MKQRAHGFTAVELLITMIIGTMLLLTAYQLYTFVLNDSADTRMRATASNLAYRFMREASSAVAKPCATYSATPTIPADASLPNATASVTITCPPYGVTLPYVTATINYGNGKVVTHATYASAN